MPPVSVKVVDMGDLTVLLKAVEQGDSAAGEQLFPLVYEELRRLAGSKMVWERPDHTLQATALVHEAWLRLGGENSPTWKNRAHFFGAAAEAMRRILVDHARRKQSERRGGLLARTNLTDLEIPAEEKSNDHLLAVHEALEKLAQLAPDKAAFVKLRYFLGLSLEEAAAAQGISVATASRWWAYARSWLQCEMER